ncbi:MAG: site-specific DNA-methyltransferase, partial [Azovibrio sp.]
VGPGRSLLVCCSAFRGKAGERWSNLTLKKIPKMVLARCEWGHDDYSLNVANLPMAQSSPAEPEVADAPVKPRVVDAMQRGLFGGEEE